MASVTIDNVTKSFGNVHVLKGIDIDVADGEFLVLVGPSGCGKSTLLNLIAGLETISTGEIRIGERAVNNVSPKDRDIAMVFQSYALYPNMDVRRNISFGMEMRKVPKAEIDATVQRVAEMLQIDKLLDRKPKQLSGGQRQRVAMGRAIARNPAVYLFDEPLSNLDAKLRVEMRTEIKKLHQKFENTIVYVTHDQIEAMTLADRIAIMKDGIVQQLDTPKMVYEKPSNVFVAGFIGSPSMNFINATLSEANGKVCVPLVNTAGQTFHLPVEKCSVAHNLKAGQEVILGIRPENIADTAPSHLGPDGEYTVEGEVEVVEPTGPDTLAYSTFNSVPTICRCCPDRTKKPGETMKFVADISKAVFFDPATEQRITE